MFKKVLEEGIDILDKDREAAIIKKGVEQINNPEYKDYYKEFITLLMQISKDLQAKLK